MDSLNISTEINLRKIGQNLRYWRYSAQSLNNLLFYVVKTVKIKTNKSVHTFLSCPLYTGNSSCNLANNVADEKTQDFNTFGGLQFSATFAALPIARISLYVSI